jgi:hypothetical protein
VIFIAIALISEVLLHDLLAAAQNLFCLYGLEDR